MCSIPDKHFATISGTPFNPLDPKIDLIKIGDIKRSLSMNCRWGGHVKQHYSVAQHTCTVLEVARVTLFQGKELPLELQQQILLHDASEAYLVDIPAPIKQQMPEYIAIENRLHKAIATKFGLKYPFDPLVHVFDKVSMVGVEAELCGKTLDMFPYFLKTEPYSSLIARVLSQPLGDGYYMCWGNHTAERVYTEELRRAKLL